MPHPPAFPGERLYLAAPISVTASLAWTDALDRLRTVHPGAVLLLPTALFRDRLDWRARLPAVLREATRLVFLTDPEGWIGKGVHTEITQAAALARPVSWLTAAGELVPLDAVDLSLPNEEDWTHYCHVRRLSSTRGASAAHVDGAP